MVIEDFLGWNGVYLAIAVFIILSIFLGVRIVPQSEKMATAISQQHGLPELLGRVLAARGVTLESVADFLDPRFREHANTRYTAVS